MVKQNLYSCLENSENVLSLPTNPLALQISVTDRFSLHKERQDHMEPKLTWPETGKQTSTVGRAESQSVGLRPKGRGSWAASLQGTQPGWWRTFSKSGAGSRAPPGQKGGRSQWGVGGKTPSKGLLDTAGLTRM